MSIPVAPYSVSQARITEGPCWLLADANDQIVAVAFDEVMAQFVLGKMNHVCGHRGQARPATINPLVASMLCAFRVHLEHELGARAIAQELEIGPLLGEMCDWFGLNMGERAIALGPAILGYLDRCQEEASDQLVTLDAIQVVEVG